MYQAQGYTGVFSPTFGDTLPTFGEAFGDNTFIELIRGSDATRPALLLWDGERAALKNVVKYRGRRYEAGAIKDTVFRELTLPPTVGSTGSARALLAEISCLADQFLKLPERLNRLIGRFVLASWLVDAMPVAPRLLIEGPDTTRARQLFKLLRCTCRRALPAAELTPATFCSLPSGMRFTLLLRQNAISEKLATVLQAAAVRGNPLVRGGELRDLFGAQVILCEPGVAEGSLWPSSICVPCTPIGQRLPVIDNDQEERIVRELQPKLLAFRFSNYRAACETVDHSKIAPPLQDLVFSLAAATPGDTELQSELSSLLEEQNAEIEAANWVDINTVIVEAILAHCREAKQESVYVGEIAEMAGVILAGRGESRKITAGEAGHRIKNLGFTTERRDARGIKLRLTNEVCVLATELAHQFQAPGVHEGDV